MAHFAELDAANTVLRVIVVANADTADADGVENESIGAEFCNRLLGVIWKQTSYNHNIRKNYAQIWFVYRPDLDAFVPPQPYPSWTLNEATAKWEAPLPRPNDGKIYFWDELTQNWAEPNQPV